MEYTSLATPNTDHTSRDDLCREYFQSGYTNMEICTILRLHHGIQISCRHLRRVLSALGLKRRNSTNMRKAAAAVKIELDGSGGLLGYRALQNRILSKYGVLVPRHLVSWMQRTLDPEGVESRRNHRLKRRAYSNDGPNFLIHIDGYDKLNRYGFAIHGAVDGFSRKVLWLRVARTNNKPEVVASYFLDYLLEIKGVPRRIRMDAGTENVMIEDIQVAFRTDHADDMAGEKSVIVGPSPSNQRVERYWRNSRESGGQFWIDLFKDLESGGHLDTNNSVQRECLRFCFTEILQTDLNTQMAEWNQHRIRRSHYAQSLAGKPDMLFYVPQTYGEELIHGRQDITSHGSDKFNKINGLVEENCPHVMISYQWGSQPVLLRVRDFLKTKGYKTWIDVDYMGGSTLQAMAEAVENSAVILICMSHKYKDSPNCRAEAEYAFQRRVPIVPLLMEENYRPDGWLGILLGSKLFYDFSGKYKFETRVEGLLKELGDKGLASNSKNKPPGKPTISKPKDEVYSGPKACSKNTSREISKWGKSEVGEWLKKQKIQKSTLLNLTGKELIFLHNLKREAPETFYLLLRSNLELNSLHELMTFVEVLEELL